MGKDQNQNTLVQDPETRHIRFMEARLAVLEEMASSTRTLLGRIETRLDAIDANQRADFRWMLGTFMVTFVGLLGFMAHGFHWF